MPSSPFGAPPIGRSKIGLGDVLRVLATEDSAARSTGLAVVHVYVYDPLVKRRELESRLRELGWTFLRHGGSHDVWTDGQRLEYLPRHLRSTRTSHARS